MKLCAFTSVCQEDEQFVTRYLAEAVRLRLPFCVHFDRCSPQFRSRFKRNPFCKGWTEQRDPKIEFRETHKQGVFDLVVSHGYEWAMAWDVDETYERDAPAKIETITSLNADQVDVRWVNLWDDERHVRTDGPFSGGHRVKFYHLKSKTWKFCHPIVNGAKAVDVDGHPLPESETTLVKYDLVTLHWGNLTREMREFKKARWDRIYSTALKGDPNPYGIWDFGLDEVNHPPQLEEHDYF